MTKKEIEKALGDLFVPRGEGLEGKCFNGEYMRIENEKCAIYKGDNGIAIY